MVFTNGVDPQLQIMERLGDMTAAAFLDNLRCPLTSGGRETCLCLHSKGDCVRSCSRSHALVQGQSQENMLRYIGICRVALDPSKKRNFNVGGDRGSYGGHWERNGGNSTMQNSEGETTGSVQYMVAEEEVMLVGDRTGITSEVDVY